MPGADPDCAERAFAGLDDDAQAELGRLVAEPFSPIADRAAFEAIVAADLGCFDPGVLRSFVAMSALRVPEFECVGDGWAGVLTPEMLAASIAHGSGLDDLSDDAVDAMAAAAAACVPADPAWWIDDIVFREEIPFRLDEGTLRCVAGRYVEVMGVTEVVRRRLVNAPLLAVPPEDEARLDLPAACAVTARGVLDLIVGGVGACVDGAGASTADAVVVGCDQPHNGEVYATGDLSSTFPTWPGVGQVESTANELCRTSVGAIHGDPGDDGGVMVIFPRRRPWEQGNRQVLCLLVHAPGGRWVGPSGFVDAAATATTTAPATTSAPSGSAEIADYRELQRPGTCVHYDPTSTSGGTGMSVVDCAVPHELELFATVQAAGQAGAAYPGAQAAQHQIDVLCAARFAEYVGTPFQSSRLDYLYIVPDEASWNEGNRQGACLLRDPADGELLTGSMAGSRQ